MFLFRDSFKQLYKQPLGFLKAELLGLKSHLKYGSTISEDSLKKMIHATEKMVEYKETNTTIDISKVNELISDRDVGEGLVYFAIHYLRLG